MSLEISREDRVLRVTLNRPEKRNALDGATCRELIKALKEADRDPAVGAVLLAARGTVFCAGMDLDEAVTPGAADETEIHNELFTFGRWVTKPVVAAVSGAALGGGVGLVANPHVVVAAQGSTFALTEIRIGMWPFVVYRSVASAVGERRALELSLTGRLFGTPEALAWGLVQHVVPAFELEDRAWSIASGIAAFSPEAIRAGLEYTNRAQELGWTEAGALALESRRKIFASPDFHEGVSALREKRKPKWPSLESPPSPGSMPSPGPALSPSSAPSPGSEPSAGAEPSPGGQPSPASEPPAGSEPSSPASAFSPESEPSTGAEPTPGGEPSPAPEPSPGSEPSPGPAPSPGPRRWPDGL